MARPTHHTNAPTTAESRAKRGAKARVVELGLHVLQTEQIAVARTAEPDRARWQVVGLGPHVLQTEQIVVARTAEPERARWQVVGVGPHDN